MVAFVPRGAPVGKEPLARCGPASPGSLLRAFGALEVANSMTVSCPSERRQAERSMCSPGLISFRCGFRESGMDPDDVGRSGGMCA